jgi:hypothetical protein
LGLANLFFFMNDAQPVFVTKGNDKLSQVLVGNSAS